MNIEKTTKLLQEFKKIPFTVKESTHLEICQYPKRRFEEICSRLLCFYFNPKKEHNFRDLFISSFFELRKRSDIRYDPEQIEIITEDNAEGKRIDLVISCPDFVIGIENKITASLYNPLEKYKERLEGYNNDNLFKIVLSVFEITKPNEVTLIESNGFMAITYSQFFEVIKKNIGQYISTCNQKYLTHLFDFIETLENMKTTTYSNKELSDFFFDNLEQIDGLVEAFAAHKQGILNLHKERIKEIQEEIIKQTNGKWWIWSGWDLGIDAYNSQKFRIGIESSFIATKDDPFDQFKIYFTTWSQKDYVPFREILKKKFPDIEPDDKSIKSRVYLHMAPIKGNDMDEIIAKLKEYYEFLIEITRNQVEISS